MPIRKKHGRVITTTTPQTRAQGRRASVAAATREAGTPGDPAERLAFALVERHVVDADIAAGRTPQTSPRAVRARIERARATLLASPEGRSIARVIATALATANGAALDVVVQAHIDARPYAARAAAQLVALVREHGFDVTASLHAARACAEYRALADLCRTRAWSIGAGGALAATRTKALDDGRVTSTVPSFVELTRLARDLDTSARHELMLAMQVQREARDARAAQPAALDVFASLPVGEPIADGPPSHDVAIGEAITVETTAPAAPTPTTAERATTATKPTTTPRTTALDRLSGCATRPERRVFDPELGGWVSLDTPPLAALRAARRFGRPIHPELQAALDAADRAETERANATTHGDQP